MTTADLYRGNICPHLTGVHRCWDKGGLREELGGSQQVTDPLVVPLVVFHGLDVHLFFGQQRFIAWRITSWWQELKISMSSTQQEPNPEINNKITSYYAKRLFLCSLSGQRFLSYNSKLSLT